MNDRYIFFIATLKLTSYHYKILLILNTGAYTTSQLSDILGFSPPNVSKYLKELSEFGLIEVDKIQGRNKYYKATKIYDSEG